MTTATHNPLGLKGLAFAEFSSDRSEMARLLFGMGFSRTRKHAVRSIEVFTQGAASFIVTDEPGTFAARFRALHGPCVASLGFRVQDADFAFREALRRGAHAFHSSSGCKATIDAPAIYGIGDSLVYFVDGSSERGAVVDRELVALARPELVPEIGITCFDHLTNNVAKGELGAVSAFYKNVFGFTEVRSFDVSGEKTGLYSYALRSPDGSFCIPINEDKGETGQIAEYLREYRGPGVQHIALSTDDLIGTLDRLHGIPTLDIDDDYYATVFDRVPAVREDRAKLKAHEILVDGDADGYLLQIFTKNVVGPVFFELIQRRNHLSFGEGNFGALFRSIERDQERRGVL